MNATENVTNEAQGNPLAPKSQVLETGAVVGQVPTPLPFKLPHDPGH